MEDHQTPCSLWFNWDMTFEPHIALNYAASIARPRRVGSGIDQEVAAEIEEKLRGWGYQVERQPFTFSTAPNVFLTLVVLAAIVLVVIMLLAHERVSIIADLAALLVMALVISFMPLNRRVQSAALEQNGRGLKWGQSYATANLIAYPSLRAQSATRALHQTAYGCRAGEQSPSGPGIASSHGEASHSLSIDSAALRSRTACAPRNDDAPHLYLVAHYDSKSQRMPLVMRITLFMLAIITGLILVALTLLDVSTLLYLPIGLLALAAAFPLLFLDVGNNSPGAIDNASSVGLVLHLAEVLAQRVDWQDKLRLTLLIPSAEEMTLMGSVAYVTAYEDTLRDREHAGGLYVLNFDGVGVDGDLYYVGRSHQSQNSDRISLLARVHRACAELNLPLKRFGFVGALFDHIPFAQRGFDAISLIAVGRASRSVHTPADAIDKLHVRGFDQAGRVALNVIAKLIG